VGVYLVTVGCPRKVYAAVASQLLI
jgi:hypothetical protein